MTNSVTLCLLVTDSQLVSGCPQHEPTYQAKWLFLEVQRFRFDAGLVTMTFGDFRVVYLGGMGRSGSTLAERLLGELPGVCVAGEIVHLWQRGVADNERCGCGTAFRACEFWSAVAEAAFGGWDKIDVGRIAELRGVGGPHQVHPACCLGPSVTAGLRRDLAEYTCYYHRLYRAIAAGQRLPGGRRLEQARLAGVLPEPRRRRWTCA